MITRVLPLLLSLLLLACTAPTDLPVTNDLAAAERLMPALGKLTVTQRQLFAAYVKRQQENPQGPSVPDGMTVGKAIEEQRNFKADQGIEKPK